MTGLHIRHLVCTDRFAGVERYLTYVAPELARRGHHVEVIGGEPRRMRSALAGTDVEFTAATSVARATRYALAGPRPDVFHAHMTAAELAAIAPSLLFGRALVSTLHFAGGRGHSPATRLAYRSIGRLVSAEVAVSHYVASTSYGNPRVVTMGIPPVVLDAGTSKVDGASEAREPIVLVAQRLEPEKVTEVAIAAWVESHLADLGWRLEIAGDGSRRADLEQLVARLGATDSVRFLGDQSDVPQLMAKASILLAPRPDEAFGLTVVEAMAASLPVVAAAGGGHLETLGAASGETLFVPGDVEQAAYRLRTLAQDPALRLEVGQRLRRRYEQAFRIEHHVDQIEGLYHEVASRPARWSRVVRPAPRPPRPPVAIAHDYLTQRGGAERVVLSLLETFPDAAIHTTVHDHSGTFDAFRDTPVVTSPLQLSRTFRRNPRLALPLLAPVVSRMRVDADVTVCSTPGWAHGVRTTGAKVLYVHNTARWLYQTDEYLDGLPRWYRWGLAPLAGSLRRWDRRAAAEADVILVNSAVTQERVRRHWGRDAEIVHPPPGLGRLGHQRPVPGLEPGFLLTVSRLLPYKRIDVLLDAVDRMNRGPHDHGARCTHLVVVGTGPDEARLATHAPAGTVWLSDVPDDQLRWLYANAEALVTAAHDDFGLAPLEAMQFGTPVVAVREGGFRETVVEGETGILFDQATPEGVCEGVTALRSRSWDRSVIEARAAEFSAEAFATRIRDAVDRAGEQRRPRDGSSVGRGQ